MEMSEKEASAALEAYSQTFLFLVFYFKKKKKVVWVFGELTDKFYDF